MLSLEPIVGMNRVHVALENGEIFPRRRGIAGQWQMRTDGCGDGVTGNKIIV